MDLLPHLRGHDEVFVGRCCVPLQSPVVGELPRKVAGVADVHAEGVLFVDRDQVRQGPGALGRTIDLCVLITAQQGMDKHSRIVGLKQQGFQCSLKPTCISSALDYSSIYCTESFQSFVVGRHEVCTRYAFSTCRLVVKECFGLARFITK